MGLLLNNVVNRIFTIAICNRMIAIVICRKWNDDDRHSSLDLEENKMRNNLIPYRSHLISDNPRRFWIRNQKKWTRADS